MNYEDVFEGECLRRVIQDVLVDRICYDKPSWGAGGYRLCGRINVEHERHGVVILAEGGQKGKRGRRGEGKTHLWPELVYESFQGILGDVGGQIDGWC